MGTSLESLEGMPKFVDSYGTGELEATAHEAILAAPSMKIKKNQ